MNTIKINSIFKRITTVMLLMIALMNIFNLSAAHAKSRKDIVIYGKLAPTLTGELSGVLEFQVQTEIFGVADTNLYQICKAQLAGDEFKVVIKPRADLVYIYCPAFPVIPFKYQFMAKPGDTLYIDGKGSDSFSFRSNHPDFYQCQLELNKVVNDLTGKNSIPADGYSNFYQHRRDTVLNEVEMILKKFQNKLDPKTRTLFQLDYTSFLNQNYMNMFIYPIIYKGDFSDQEIGESVKKVKALYQEIKPLDDVFLIKNSMWYAAYIYELERLYHSIGLAVADFRQVRFEKTYQAITTKYSGLLREKLLTHFFIRLSKDSYHAPAYLKKEMPGFADPLYRKVLLGLQRSNTAGNDAYPFGLKGEDDKVHSLADFKGKVLVCDFWFTGCGGCIGLAAEMLPLKEKYKDNPNVVFISINVDKSKEKWKQGIDEGIYTSRHDLNLYTNGQGIYHPILEFYRYAAFPQLLLIDKEGKIISSGPERPSSTESFNKLDELIQAHLK